MRAVMRQMPHLEVIAILWFVRMTDAIHMTGCSIGVQRGPFLWIDSFGTFDMWPFSLLHELRRTG